MYHKILVPLDGSKQAESALHLASMLARISNAEITLLRVVEYPMEMYSSGDLNSRAYPSRFDEKLQMEKDAFCKEAEAYLKLLASILEKNVSKLSVAVQECPVVDAILRTTKKSEIDLIVMSAVGQGHNPWMIGAVANRLLRESPVPVFLLGKMPHDYPRQQRVSKQNEAMLEPDTLFY
jgi:nucleotide-binding universal stress UspA family protein